MRTLGRAERVGREGRLGIPCHHSAGYAEIETDRRRFVDDHDPASIREVQHVLCGANSRRSNSAVHRAGHSGIGAGGLLALVQIVMADIIGPRERGKYMVNAHNSDLDFF